MVVIDKAQGFNKKKQKLLNFIFDLFRFKS
jgi:hypothetical protein